jgi:hypothetical protein
MTAGRSSARPRKKWDAFLSHAGEDKAAVAIPLTEMLLDGGLKIWTDYKELEVGG